MNKRKYLYDVYTWAFDATIEKVNDDGGIILNQTFFYPEGGGQPSDTGSLNHFPLLDVKLIGHDVVHYIDGTLKAGESVHGIVDANKRLGYMQQHTAQHLISAFAYRLFSANTVGLHISDAYFTVDFDVKLDAEALTTLMDSVDSAIVQGIHIKSYFVEPDKIDDYALRKAPKVSENIRIVEIEGIDYSPCGGTHLSNTRELGCCFVQKIENYKSGVRLTVKAGLYAQDQLKQYHHMLSAFSKQFAVMPLEALSYTQKLATELDQTKKALESLERSLIEKEVDELLADYGESDAIYYLELLNETYPMLLLREKVQAITEKVPSVVLAISTYDQKRHFVLSKSKDILPDLKMGALFKTHFSTIGIKGGGNDIVAQGGCEITLPFEDASQALDETIQNAIQNAQ